MNDKKLSIVYGENGNEILVISDDAMVKTLITGMFTKESIETPVESTEEGLRIVPEDAEYLRVLKCVVGSVYVFKKFLKACEEIEDLSIEELGERIQED